MSYIYSHIAQLRPTEGMVHVVFAEVVLGQVGDIRLLDMRDVRRVEKPDIHLRGDGAVLVDLEGVLRKDCSRTDL